MTAVRPLRQQLFTPRTNPVFIAGLLGGIAILTIATILIFGIQQSGDMHRYIDRGNGLWSTLLSSDGNFKLSDPWVILYLLPNLANSALARLYSNHAMALSVLGNVILYSGLVVVTMRTWVKTRPLTLNLLLASSALFLFYGIPGEVTKYLGLYLGSDILFMCLSGFALCALTRSQLLPSRRMTAAALLIAAACLLTRPPGLVTFLAVLCGVSLGRFYTSRAFIAWVLIGSLAAALLAWPAYIEYLLTTKADTGTGMDYVLHNYKYGVVVSGYDNSYVPRPRVYLDYVGITLLRMMYYIVPIRIDYSPLHIFVNLCYVGVLIFLVARGCRHLIDRGRQGHRLLLSIVLYTLWMTLFHAMTQVEDWRYELPIWPALWLAAGFGLPAAGPAPRTG